MQATVVASLFLNGLAVGGAALYFTYNKSDAMVGASEGTNEAEKQAPNTSHFPAPSADKQMTDTRSAPNPDLDTQPTIPASQPVASQDAASQPATAELQRLFDSGDKLALAGDYARAMRVFKEVAELNSQFREMELRTRLAFCDETMGDLPRALSLYRSVADEARNDRLIAASQIGLARIMLRQKQLGPAKQQLWKLFLDSNRYHNQADFRAEGLFLLADTHLQELQESAPKSLASHDRIVNVALCGPTSEFFKLLVLSADGEEQASRSPLSVLPAGNLSAQVYVDPNLQTATVSSLGIRKLDLLREFTAQSGLHLQLSELAQRQLERDYQDVDCQQIKLDLLLDALLLSSDLVWTTKDQTLQVGTRDEMQAVAEQSNLAAVERLLRHNILVFPEHYCATPAKLAMANVGFWQEDTASARDQYRNLLREPLLKRKLSVIRYNLGICSLKLGDLEEAEKQLQQVVDNAMEGPELGLAHLHLGILQLEQGYSSQAIRTLSRALAASNDRERNSAICITMAIAYLHRQDPFAAIKTLQANATYFTSQTDLATATFVATYARFRAEGSDSPDAAPQLLSATTKVQPSDFAGLLGFHLVALAYRNLNLMDESRQILQNGFDQPIASNLRGQIGLALAELHAESGDTEAAKSVLLAVQSSDPKQSSCLAMLQLAKLYYDGGEWEQAITACRQAIALDEELALKTETLSVLGKVFEQQGNHISAAMCFAGLLPKFEINE